MDLPCAHKHLVFQNMGATLHCVDCPRHFRMMAGNTLTPDLGYYHSGTPSGGDSRHGPGEAPRTLPLPKPQKVAKGRSL